MTTLHPHNPRLGTQNTGDTVARSTSQIGAQYLATSKPQERRLNNRRAGTPYRTSVSPKFVRLFDGSSQDSVNNAGDNTKRPKPLIEGAHKLIRPS